MHRVIISALALGLAFVGLACTAAQNPPADSKGNSKPPTSKPEPKICTEMACSDAATIDTKLTAAGAPLGKHEFSLEVDGAAQACTVDFTDATQISHGTCSGSAGVWLGPAMRGIEKKMDGAVMFTQEPIPGEFAWQITLAGTPAKAHVVQSHDGKVLLDQTAEFGTYADHRPNGEGCDPVCKVASVAWKGP